MNEQKVRILRENLAQSEIEFLRALTDDFAIDPFHYCRQTREFEPDEAWSLRQEDFSDEMIDLMLKCCQILSEHVELAEGEPADEETGTFTLHFEFFAESGVASGDSLDVAEHFTRYLRKSPAYRVDVRRTGSGSEVDVTFTFLSNFDFYRQKSDIYWLLQLARRKASNSPYGGTRT